MRSGGVSEPPSKSTHTTFVANVLPSVVTSTIIAGAAQLWSITSERKAMQVGLDGVEKDVATLSNDIKAMGATLSNDIKAMGATLSNDIKVMGAKLDTCVGDLRELKGRMDATFPSVSASTYPAGKR
jgi:hypothetical protein